MEKIVLFSEFSKFDYCKGISRKHFETEYWKAK